MWRTDTLWFDLALVATIYAFGATLFGRFEEHRPRGRRALKVAALLTLSVALAATAGRGWMLALLGGLLVVAVVVHGWWLPRHGVNGWTAEPRERYYALLGLGPDGRSPSPSSRRDAR
jgi:hypothetical protein